MALRVGLVLASQRLSTPFSTSQRLAISAPGRSLGLEHDFVCLRFQLQTPSFFCMQRGMWRQDKTQHALCTWTFFRSFSSSSFCCLGWGCALRQSDVSSSSLQLCANKKKFMLTLRHQHCSGFTYWKRFFLLPATGSELVF